MAITKCVNEITFDPSSEHRVSAIIRGMQPIAGFMTRFDTISTMHAHAHLGGVGCFMMLIVGVSYKLIPMFTLSEVQSRRRAIYSVGLLNLGLAGSFVTILLHSRWKIAFACLVIAALTIYGVELSAIVRARKRRPLDWGIKYFLTATALLLPLSATAGILAWPGLPMNSFTNQLENMYGFLGFIGAVSLAIIGMLYQIIPFLVWFARYSREIGRAKVPSLADMYSPRLQAAGYWLYLAGLTLTCAATALASEAGVRVGCILLAGSLATVAANVARMLAHLYRPNIKPLAVRLSTIPAPI